MRRIHVFGGTAVLMACALGALVSRPALAAPGGDGGGDAAAVAEKVAKLRQMAAEARAAGKLDAAEELERKARAVEEQAVAAQAANEERQRAKARIAELEALAAKAKAEGRLDEARRASQEAEELARKFKGPKPPSGDADFDRMAAELREKARVLRERGSIQDAEHLEEKAARAEKSAALRRESNDLERQAKEARAAGDEERARKLAEASGDAWRRSQEAAGVPQKKPGGDIDGVLRGSPQEVTARIEGLRTAARNLREAGMPDKAEQLEAQATAAERALRDREAAATGRPAREIDELRAELDKLRRRMAEIEEEIRRREGK